MKLGPFKRSAAVYNCTRWLTVGAHYFSNKKASSSVDGLSNESFFLFFHPPPGEFFIPKLNKQNLQYPYNASNANRFRDYGAWDAYAEKYPDKDLVYQVRS